MAKKSFAGKQFEVSIPCRIGRKRFVLGDKVTQDDFKIKNVTKVIENWLDIGVLKEVKNGGW